MRRRTSLVLTAAAIASLVAGLAVPASAADGRSAASSAAASPAAAVAAPDGSAPVYRFWSPTFRAHFYTMSVDERDYIMATWPDGIWSYEGAKFGGFDTAQPGTVPLYRFWSARYNGHFYTTSETEMLHVRAVYDSFTWGYEGVAFYVYPEDSPIADTRPVARFFSPTFVHHFYTADATEADFVKANYPAPIWTYENDNFRVPSATPAAAPLPQTFGDGYHQVGASLPAGRYRSPGGAGCDWVRLDGDDEVLSGSYLDGAQVVDIDSGDGAFWTAGCGTWRRVADASVNNRMPSQFPAGMVIVGRDIAPGVYQSGSLTTCYWERLSGFAGTLDQVIDSDEVDGWAQITVTIEPTDVGFAAAGDCSGWVKIG